MAEEDLTEDLTVGSQAISERSKYRTMAPFNLKYPSTVGEGFDSETNYNSNESSEYAKLRSTGEQTGIHQDAIEPFMFFEFMTLMTKNNSNPDSFKKLTAAKWKVENLGGTRDSQYSQSWASIIEKSQETVEVTANGETVSQKAYNADQLFTEFKKSKGYLDPAIRIYDGSVALYMPTDIQVNDSVMYNDNTRKTFGTIGGLTLDAFNTGSAGSIASGKAAVGAGGAAVGKGLEALFKKSSSAALKSFGGVVGGLAGVAGADIIGDEFQRSTGKASNAHEYMAYGSTAMRTFSFSWTFLPDSKAESDSAAAIIKHFRMAAHATKNDVVTINVPDHVIVSFHGSKDMIQLPPLVIETVNVTYNPNNSSFFRHGNAPVEIGLTVSFKEIVPIYRADVTAGY